MAINNIKGVVIGGAAVGGGNNAPIISYGFSVGESYGVQVNFFAAQMRRLSWQWLLCVYVPTRVPFLALLLSTAASRQQLPQLPTHQLQRISRLKTTLVFDGSMQAKIIATILGLAGEIEREFICQRTKEALAARVEKGITLGRPKGKAARLKLDDKREDIEKYYKMGLSLREIGKLLNIASKNIHKIT